jgi:hypothetical protein
MALPVIAVVAVACFIWWPHIRNEFFVILGSRNEPGGWYGFHSGAGGAAWMSVIPLALGLYWHKTCHRQWCPRLAHYDFTDADTGLTYRLCRACHPQHPGHPLTRHHIARIHAANRERESR